MMDFLTFFLNLCLDLCGLAVVLSFRAPCWLLEVVILFPLVSIIGSWGRHEGLGGDMGARRGCVLSQCSIFFLNIT